MYVSVNGGPFSAWLSNTPATSATYDGAFGNTYAFFSIARDQVGHVEAAKTIAEATVNVIENAAANANAGPDQIVRLGSLVTLNGGGSSDPDAGPAPLGFAWTQATGPSVTLNGFDTAALTLTVPAVGLYTFELAVSDGVATSGADGVAIRVPLLGDIDLDNDVDQNDLTIVVGRRNTPADGPNDLKDLNGDGGIDVNDARRLSVLCTRPRCAVQ